MMESCESLNNQAIRLSSDGQFPEAIACFKRALTMDNKNYLLWYNLGITYRDSGNFTEAKSAVEQAFNLNPNDEEILETLALLCFNTDSIDEAFYYCNMGLYLNNSNSHFWNTMGVLLFNQSEYEDASECFETAVSINPYYYDALYNLRDTYDELGNTVGRDECSAKLKNLSGE